MTQQTSAEKYVVAYGYSQTFYLTEKEAQALVAAREQEAKIVKFQNRVFSTNFTWIVPVSEVESDRLDEKELEMAEMVGKWLARPVHDLDFTPESAMRYAKKLVKRIGCGQVKRLWDVYANGAYPSAKKFLMEAKEISSIQSTALPDEI